ncbi:4-oxalomesaconate tautomerase [Enteractinococcus coprophilus]|uniref:4-oxalomesaconate tautomerase n=1 Tax=Enteractinococcus coprophilus TaxID=1027633 RepID=A0A543AN53_9MICC|nr:4-oxalomesaconate tautomerase [Enteractinococcus coprophilus]TQL73989.1 4-oxalomesaconate tautomerase [Enteractinococcus coprophilus]
MTTTAARRLGDQTAIPMCLMRGGTSRGPMFLAADLPDDPQVRDQVLLAVMGSPHPLQVDGLGGAHSLTSKAGIIERSDQADVDLDFTFVQLQPEATTVQTTQNCGNMLAAVVPFAVEAGLIHPTEDATDVVVRTTNTGLISRIGISTPQLNGQRYVRYSGDAEIAGVNGTASPVNIRFLNTAGSIASALLPTGNVSDAVEVEGQDYTVTFIDNGQPLVIIDAEDLGVTGYETVAELTENTQLKTRVEALRLAAAKVMGLGDVTEESYPKMTLVAAPKSGGAISTRSFIPHRVHESIGVLAAVTVATALLMDGTVAARVGVPGTGQRQTIGIEHPTGIFEALVDVNDDGEVVASGNTRTARLISRGEVYVPASIWDPSGTEKF